MSFRTFILRASTLIFLISSSWAGNDLRLPDFGDSSDRLLSASEQADIARHYTIELRKLGILVEDPLIEDYLNNLGYRLVVESSEPTQHYSFQLLNSRVVNAFATPGGFIAVHAGLFLETQREDQLAAVMAHEVAHVARKHILRGAEATIKDNLPVMLAMLGAVLLGSGDSDVTGAALAMGQGMMAQNQINHTRENEYEADRLGIQTLALAGFEPVAMAEFFGRMQKLYGSSGDKIPELLRTHPISSNRIAEARHRADIPVQKSATNTQMDYGLIRERIRVLTHANPCQLVDDYQRKMDWINSSDEQSLLYGQLLAQQLCKSSPELLTQVRKLPDSIPLQYRLLLEADTLIVLREYEEADVILDRLQLQQPRSKGLMMSRVRLLENRGLRKDLARAREILLSATVQFPDTPGLYEMLARIESKSGDEINATLMNAHALFLNGQNRSAIEQLRFMKKRKDLNYYQRSTLEARLEEYINELPEKEKRRLADSSVISL